MSEPTWRTNLRDGLTRCVMENSKCTLIKVEDIGAALDALADFDQLKKLLNTPEVEDFDKAIPLEAAHQQKRWGAKHDEGKEPEDWFWLVGYLAGKALAAFKVGEFRKSQHHCISTAAALRNWHAHIRSGKSEMRPGIETPKEDAVPFKFVSYAGPITVLARRMYQGAIAKGSDGLIGIEEFRARMALGDELINIAVEVEGTSNV